jgi:hypothetical protein
MDLKNVRYESMECIHLVQDKIQGQALVNLVINLKCLTRQRIFDDLSDC